MYVREPRCESQGCLGVLGALEAFEWWFPGIIVFFQTYRGSQSFC